MTTTQTTHTPFSLVLDECRDAQGAYTLRLADGTANGDTKACPIATVYQDHNAAHIVHCVNTYPALLAALKLAHLHMAETEGLLQHCEAWGDDEQDVLEQIRNAIKQAEGGTQP